MIIQWNVISEEGQRMKDELRWLRNQAVDGDLDQKQTWEVAYEFSFSSVE